MNISELAKGVATSTTAASEAGGGGSARSGCAIIDG